MSKVKTIISWAVMSVFFVAGCLFLFGTGVVAVMEDSCIERYPNFDIKQQPDGIRFDGGISTTSMRALLLAIQQRQEAAPEKPVTVWLESGGGDVEAALFAAAMIPTYNVTMAVGKGGFCGSSCVPLFLSSDKRYADPSAAFGLHAVFCAGRLADLECLAERAYGESADRYMTYVKRRDPALYALAERDHAFSNPPYNLVCYTYPNGAENAPVSEESDHRARGSCMGATDRMSYTINHDMMMPPGKDAQQLNRCPVGDGRRWHLFLEWIGQFFGGKNLSVVQRVHYPGLTVRDAVATPAITTQQEKKDVPR